MSNFNPAALRHCLKANRKCKQCPRTETDMCFSSQQQAQNVLTVVETLCCGAIEKLQVYYSGKSKSLILQSPAVYEAHSNACQHMLNVVNKMFIEVVTDNE